MKTPYLRLAFSFGVSFPVAASKLYCKNWSLPKLVTNRLLAVGQLSHAMTAYRIDPASGRLAPQASLPLGKNPNWVEIIDLP